MSDAKRKCPLLLLLRFLCQAIVAAADGFPKDGMVMHLNPTYVHDLVEAENRTVEIKVSLSESELAAAARDNNGSADVPWRLQASSMHGGVVSVCLDEECADATISRDTSSKIFTTQQMNFDNGTRFYTLDSTLQIKGEFLGKTGVQIRLVRADDWLDGDERQWDVEEEQWQKQIKGKGRQMLEVWVKRNKKSERLTHIFVGTLMILIPLANILMGCELDLSVVMATIRRPTAPLIGLFTQFAFMPLLAYAIARSVFIPTGEYSLALGLFVTGCAPGGGASNFWTILLDGNVNLSVTMTFISTLASFVMMPLWIALLGKEFLVGFGEGTRIKVPYSKIGSSLATLIVPLLIGVLIARRKPAWAAKARKVMRPFIIFVLIFVVGFGAASNLYMFRMLSVRAMIGGLLLPWCGFMVGCFASIITRRAPADVTAIAIETGIQNTGIAILLLKFSFPAPDSDISSLLPVIVACFTPGPLLMGAAVHMTLKALKKRRTQSVDAEKSTSPVPFRVDGTHDMVGANGGQVILQLPSTDSPATGLMLVEMPPVIKEDVRNHA